MYKLIQLMNYLLFYLLNNIDTYNNLYQIMLIFFFFFFKYYII